MFLLTPILALLFSRSNPTFKIASWLIVTTLTLAVVVANGAIVTTYGLNKCTPYSLTSFDSQKLNEYETMIYNKPWTRGTPYLIGFAAAFLYAHLGGQAQTRRVRLARAEIAWAWFVGSQLLIWPIWGTYYMRKPSDILGCNWDGIQNFFYLTFSSLSWSLGVAFVTLAGLLDIGGPVTWILSRGTWAPLSRIAYCAYIVNPMVLIVVFYSVNTAATYTDGFYIMYFLGIAAINLLVAAVFHLAVEKPFCGLQKMYLKK